MIVAAGTVLFAKSTGRIMLVLRSGNSSHPLTWGFLGGKMEDVDGNLGETLDREISEEIGTVPGVENTFALDDFESPDGRFKYVSYVTIIRREFVPDLNRENEGYCWVNQGRWPKPLHPSAWNILSDKDNVQKLEHFSKVYVNKE